MQGLRPSYQAAQLSLDQTAKNFSPKKDQSIFANLFSISIIFVRNPDQRRKYVIASDIVWIDYGRGPAAIACVVTRFAVDRSVAGSVSWSCELSIP